MKRGMANGRGFAVLGKTTRAVADHASKDVGDDIATPTALMRMPCSMASSASVRVSWSSAPLSADGGKRTAGRV